MKKQRLLVGLAGILLIGTIVFIYTDRAYLAQEPSGNSKNKRADILTIDVMKKFGHLERSEVIFFHDLHTDTLDKKKKDCTTCHLMEKEDPSLPRPSRLSLKFKRLEDLDKEKVMDIYHSECMSCHREMSDDGEKTGPIEACGECHLKEPVVSSSQQPIILDKSLHFRHSEAHKDTETGEADCAACHHEYNKATKKLFYAKGKEGSCRYCHKMVTEENRISVRLASHQACVDCHRKKWDQEEEKTSGGNRVAGPVKCSGCHDPLNQRQIAVVEDAPRMKRNQPDIVLIRAGEQKPQEGRSLLKMNPVPFDHRAHEQYNDTCIVCHHESLDSCTKTCHTQRGSSDGKNIQLERAMHQIDANMSCMGCHEINQRDKNCAGCHTFMAKNRKHVESTCLVCHITPLGGDPGSGQKPEVMAGMMLQKRSALRDTYSDEDIPEQIVIGELLYQYGVVEFPHRKIVKALVNNMVDNKLAGYFHAEKGTICQACHHNSPETKKPPSCTSCHGRPFDEKNPLRPGLKAAYHQQCFGCHEAMKIEKPSSTVCTDCHKKVGLPQL